MSPRPQRSLLGRILAAQGLALALLGTGFLAYTALSAWREAAASFDSALAYTANALDVGLRHETDPIRIREQALRVQTLDEQLVWAGLLEPGEYQPLFQVFDRSGRLVLRSDAAPEAPFSPAAAGHQRVEVEGRRLRVLVLDQPDSPHRILVAQSQDLRSRVIRRAVLPIALFLAALFAGVAAATWWGARRALNPLLELARTLAHRRPDTLTPLEPPADLRETRPLVEALNGLFGRMGQMLATQRRFVADAAHELRTPLAVVGTQAHALHHAPDGPERDATAADLQEGITRAAALVRQLLAVARMDASEVEALAMETFDLGVLAREQVAGRVPLALSKRLDLGVEGEEHLPLRGSVAILRTALDNLVDNAIRYSPEGGSITVRLSREGEAARLDVEDEGPGIPAEYRNQVFDRFFRVPGTAATGSGLGLAIVRRAVSLHGGTVALLDAPGGKGLLVRVTLPIGRLT